MSQPPEFKYFERLPPEIRNIIYTFNLKKDTPISITSRRSRRERAKVLPGNHTAGFLRVSKQIHKESKTIFYSLNTFIIGNSCWNSKVEPNLQALKEFLLRVPKDCIASIKKIETHIYADRCLWWRNEVILSPGEGREFQEIAALTVKEFIGVEEIDIRLRKTYEAHHPTKKFPFAPSRPMVLRGALDPMAKGMAVLMTCPRLQVVTTYKRYGMHWTAFWTLVGKWRVELKVGEGSEEQAVAIKEVTEVES